ncbi:hypothetical protein [Terrimonas ferruginea]|uniref:hypothetical protein n=1 Tax=Terrimonas ferruginea TaxID=249 RepID=UPI00048A6BAC|nr:hypothetical protein [Terrimonas ferruginea]
MNKIKIEVYYIERLFERLIERLKKDGFDTLSFDNELYWNIPLKSIDIITEEPDLTIGSLEDDIHFLKSLIDEDYDTQYLELERLAAVLKNFSKKVSSFDEEA